MRIGILTFHSAQNYGAVLQTYALQEYLRGLGHDVSVIDYRPSYIEEYYKLFSWGRIPKNNLIIKIKFLLREILALPVRMRRAINYKDFVTRNIKLSPYNDTSMQKFDAIIFGSDQIWNPIICNGIDEVYFGEVPRNKHCKLISYAASVGSVDYLSRVNELEIVKHLKKFTALSCRERELAVYLSRKIYRDVETVLDPVLLAGKCIISQLTKRIHLNKTYILLFTIVQFPLARKVAYDMARKLGVEVIEIVSDQISITSPNVKHVVAVQDFLGYIEGALMVITASFHGTALSLLYEKDFYYVANDSKIAKRVENLLKPLNLAERIISSSEQCVASKINYEDVNAVMEHERQNSVNFLSKL